MDTEYVSKVREWVALDNLLTERKEGIREATDKRRGLEEEILAHVEERGLDKLTINISDGLLRFSRRTTSQALSGRALRSLLDQYVEEKRVDLDVDDVISFVQERAPGKSKLVMSRVIRAPPQTARSGGDDNGSGS